MTQEKPKKVAIGITWYRPGEWNEVKAYCEDGKTLENTYDEWKRGATKALHDLRREGEHVEQVDFDFNEFRMWCETQGKKPNASSRSEFTVLRLRQRHQADSKP